MWHDLGTKLAGVNFAVVKLDFFSASFPGPSPLKRGLVLTVYACKKYPRFCKLTNTYCILCKYTNCAHVRKLATSLDNSLFAKALCAISVVKFKMELLQAVYEGR